tara:strand:+ start:9672 stop:10970 length:1299 start_codon:yes stop_codon:yes gene_type:complete
MIKILVSKSKNFNKQLEYYLSIRRQTSASKLSVVKKILKDVKKNKDKSLTKYEKKFNKVRSINKKDLVFTNSEIRRSIKKLDNRTKNSINIAYERILNFHKKQKFKNYKFLDKYKNTLSYRSLAIENVGVYVPGGTANYPSSVLMNCIPAMVAGVKKIFVTVPSIGNKVSPGVLYAAYKCKVKKIYKLGGAQAIAAFAYGTDIVEKVDKIVGPGNEYVALAKKEVFGQVGIDMFAGPSEVTIIADSNSNPEWLASDLIAQSEHDEMSQSILITDSKKLITEVKRFLDKNLRFLPKKRIVMNSFKKFGMVVLAKNKKEISKITNKISPEHLQIYTKEPNVYLKNIKNAGSIFLGAYSPAAMGDYLAGSNHVLPTSGTAKFSSGLSVYDFLKRQSVIKITKSGIERLGPSVINLAEYENLKGHANSIKVRIKQR